MGCGCGGGRRNASSGRARTVTPQSTQRQLRPTSSPTVRAQGVPTESTNLSDRQEIERKRKIQISLRKRNGPQ